jgi:methylase of polypeptide subunit release factors
MIEHSIDLSLLAIRLKSHSEEQYAKLKDLIIRHRKDFEVYSFKKEYSDRRVPSNIMGSLHNEEIELLLSTKMIDRWHGSEYMFQFRIHYIDKSDCSFLNEPVIITTDFPLDHQDRVFPWVDEGKLTVNKIHLQISPDTQTILNMCCGAGTIAILLAKLLINHRNLQIEGVDVNPRAIAIAQFNQRLNGISSANMKFTSGDMFNNLLDSKYELIVADPPFALQPTGMEEHKHSQGGEHGDEKIKLFLKDVRKYLDPNKGQFYLLAYSLGSVIIEDGEKINISELLDNNNLHNSQLIRFPNNQPVWRFGDEKQVAINPMPVQYMSIRCGDPTYRISEDLSRINKYIKWIQEDLVEKGFTHLFYLIVHYSVNENNTDDLV